MEEKTKICSNCEEPIPESKLFLHERFCAQNIKKCKICKKPIVIDDEEQHMVENHSEVKCEFCEKPFPKNEIEEHIKNCDQKMVECQYCELQVTIKDKPQHEYMCGAKTEQCMKCKKYIQVKDMKNHKRVGCKLEEKVTNNNLLISDPQLEKAIMKSIKDNNKKNNYNIGNNHNIPQKLIQTNAQKKIKKTENIPQNISSVPQESSAIKPLVHKENVNPLLHDKKITTMNIPVSSGIGKVNQNRAFKPTFSSKSQVKIMIPNKINNTGNSTKPQPQNEQKVQNQKKNAPTIVKHNKDDIDNKKQKVKPEFAKGFKFSKVVPQNPNDINQQKPLFRNDQNNSGLGTSKTSFKFTPQITSTKGKGLTNNNNNIIRPASKNKANPKKNNKPFEINHFDGDYLPVSIFLTFL